MGKEGTPDLLCCDLTLPYFKDCLNMVGGMRIECVYYHYKCFNLFHVLQYMAKATVAGSFYSIVVQANQDRTR